MNFIFPYRLVILVSIILLLSMFECESGEHRKMRIESGIKNLAYYESCLFFTPEIGLVGGQKEGNAYCWKTTDGGRHWQQKKKLANGMVWDLTEKDGVAYATVVKREKDTLLYTHSVYISCDQGENWQLKCEIVAENTFIDLLVLNDKRMFMVLKTGLLETRDGGKNWELTREREPCRKLSIDDKYLYYSFFHTSPERVSIYYLVRRSLTSGKERLVKLPIGHDVNATCGDVVIIGKSKHMGSYRLEEDMTLTFLGQLKQQSYDIEYIYRQGKQLYATMMVSIGLYKLLYSPDGGHRWKFVDKGSWGGAPTCMLSDSSQVQIFILDMPHWLRSYQHKRIFSD